MHKKATRMQIGIIVCCVGLSLFAVKVAIAEGPRSRAVKFVRNQGYHPVKRQFHKRQALRVITGRKHFGCCRLGRKVFFFVRREGFVRRDVNQASFTGVEIEGQSNDEISVRYGPLYHRGDASCCASGGFKTVRFRWNGQKVWSVDKVPSPCKRSGCY